MKKKITGSVLSAGAIVLGLAAAGCGGAIENAADGWAMLGYTLLAIVLGCAALALAGLGLVVEQRKESQKIHKVPENTVKKAVCRSQSLRPHLIRPCAKRRMWFPSIRPALRSSFPACC